MERSSGMSISVYRSTWVDGILVSNTKRLFELVIKFHEMSSSPIQTYKLITVSRNLSSAEVLFIE